MISRHISILIIAILLAALLAPFMLGRGPAWANPPADNTPIPKFTLKDPCALDANNLVTNGSMGPGHDMQHGSVADSWDAFIYDGVSPSFRWVGNEQIDPNGSQQIYSTDVFDAGIEQTVRNLQPNTYYMFRLGYSLAAKSYSGPNVRVDSIGRKVGVDPFGGTDAKSPNVIWGPDYFNGQAALNLPEMTMIFAARSPNATIFLRAMARDGSGGENRVWLDAVCMQSLPNFSTATPAAPTATTAPLVTPTSTARPSPTRASATRVAQAPSSPTRPQVVIRAPDTATPTVETSIDVAPAAPPRFARPDVTPAPSLPIDLGQGALGGTGVIMFTGGLIFFGIGIRLWGRIY